MFFRPSLEILRNLAALTLSKLRRQSSSFFWSGTMLRGGSTWQWCSGKSIGEEYFTSFHVAHLEVKLL